MYTIYFGNVFSDWLVEMQKFYNERLQQALYKDWINVCMTVWDGIHVIIAVVQVNGIIIIIWEAKGPAATRCPRQLADCYTQKSN